MHIVRRPTACNARTGGFTLIELMIAVTLIGVLSAMAIWRTAPALQRATVNRVVAVLAGDFQYAQLVAARQRRPVVFIATPAVQAWMIRDADSAAIVFRERFVGLGTDFGIDSLEASPTSVEVFPNGVARESITFVVGLNGYAKQVRLTRAGQVRITP